MKRGDLYRVYRGSKYDPKNYRVFLVVSRQAVIDSQFSTVVCAPVYSKYDGFTTQVEIGIDEGLKHDSAIYCDELVSLPKFMLTDFAGSLSPRKLEAVNNAIRIALAIG
ncbi:MAG: type II toxin-antitoxin system PemK/MazF family toxin [Treponema sp.]|jgi:mRNA interferase MazF|nr:type II toxin-antitoxin system PemK/MazF family toxin [Treponema sp.]